MLASLALLALTAAPALSQARDTVRIDVATGSRVWIEGGSNVHDWTCRAAAFDARVELNSMRSPRDGADAIRRVSVRVAVRDLKCGNRKMEHDLYAALKATDPANPSFIIAVFDAVTGSPDTTIATRGTLSVAGVEHEVGVPIVAERGADGRMRARGSVPLLMTDFGVKPPVGLFGLIRSKNAVTVKFELVIDALTPN